MTTFVALLRGINVSGQKIIRMADLRNYLGELDFEGVRTYIQSGNVIFQAQGEDREQYATAIREKILEKYGFEVPTLVKTAGDLELALSQHPFKTDEAPNPKEHYITFLNREPEPELVTPLLETDYSPEQWKLVGSHIYFYSPLGYGRSKMNNNFFERKLKVTATARNRRTVGILLDMCREN